MRIQFWTIENCRWVSDGFKTYMGAQGHPNDVRKGEGWPCGIADHTIPHDYPPTDHDRVNLSGSSTLSCRNPTGGKLTSSFWDFRIWEGDPPRQGVRAAGGLGGLSLPQSWRSWSVGDGWPCGPTWPPSTPLGIVRVPQATQKCSGTS